MIHNDGLISGAAYASGRGDIRMPAMHRRLRSTWRVLCALATSWPASALCAAACLLAFYPGVMRVDSFSQFEQALSGRYGDWHPPIMAWLWSVLNRISQGPQMMLALHVGLYWLGIGATAQGLRLAGRQRTAGLLVLAALSPMLLGFIGVIFKDTGVAASLVAAAGLVARYRFPQQRVPAWIAVTASVLIAYGAFLRFNGIFAAVPLLLYVLSRIDGWRRLNKLIAVATLCVLLGLAMQTINYRLLAAERMQPELSLIIYDLGGITYWTDEDQFKVPVWRDFTSRNRDECYSRTWWDTYGFQSCSFVFREFRQHLQDTGQSPLRLWLTAIARHPVAYLQHRFAHFNINIRFLLPYGTRDVTFVETVPNRHGLAFESNVLTRTIQAGGLALAATPLGWPVTWLAIAIGLAMIAPRMSHRPSRALVQALSASAILYGCGYAVFSVASDLRYHYWTMLAATVAGVVALPEIRRLALAHRLQSLIAALPTMLVAAIGIIWRIFDLPMP